MWLLYRLRYNNKTADERSTASVPSSSIFLIQILLKLCLTLVLLTKTLLRHYPSSPLCTQPLEFGTFLACTWKRRALVSQIIILRVTIATWVFSLTPSVCPWWSKSQSREGRALLLARKIFHGNICISGSRFWKWGNSRRWERWLRWVVQSDKHSQAYI